MMCYTAGRVSLIRRINPAGIHEYWHEDTIPPIFDTVEHASHYDTEQEALESAVPLQIQNPKLEIVTAELTIKLLNARVLPTVAHRKLD